MDAFSFAAKAIPEVHERLGQIERLWPANAQVGIAPLGGVESADVVAADEGDLAVHDEQLAVIQGVAARIEDVPGAANRPEREHGDGGRKLLKGVAARRGCRRCRR